MADYDSDSSAGGGDDIETNVLLGYASKEPTGDDFSQLGGHPIWLDPSHTPSANLATCKVCNNLMNLLLQLNGDLPDKFPGHERRLYVWACRRKACRRKEGSVRGFRGVRVTGGRGKESGVEEKKSISPPIQPAQAPQTGLGEALFGVGKSTSTVAANPFSTPSTNGASSNPFASASSLAAKPPQTPSDTTTETLPQTFAEKARLSSPSTPKLPSQPTEPWPSTSTFPSPYPTYYIDAEKEYIDSTPAKTPSNVRVDTDAGGSSGGGIDKELFESTMDKTFQRFADRLSENPEQILRYEFGGAPLLYSTSDAVGKSLDPSHAETKVKSSAAGNIPRCANCGAGRVFELQLTPHAITELEAEEMSIDGMDWGTILLGACGTDCQQKGVKEGEVGFVEEWVGVQWEEVSGKK